MRAATVAFELLLMALLGYVLFSSFWDLTPRGRLVPLVIAVPTTALLAFTLLSEWFPRLTRMFNVSLLDFATVSGTHEGGDLEGEESQMGGGQEVRLVLQTAGWVAMFFLATYFLGFLISIPIFMMSYLLLSARLVWWRAILITGTVLGVVWVVFVKVMGFRIFEGLLFDAFIPPI